MTIALGMVLLASLLAAASDVRTRRIPNALVGVLFVGGVAVNAFAGWKAAGIDVILVLALLPIGTVMFSFKLIGGGDVKLLAVAAGTLGYPLGVFFLLFTMMCGGIIALGYAALRGRLRTTFANIRALAHPLLSGVRPARPDGTPMPYALAIFAGALCTALIHGVAPHVRLLQ